MAQWSDDVEALTIRVDTLEEAHPDVRFMATLMVRLGEARGRHSKITDALLDQSPVRVDLRGDVHPRTFRIQGAHMIPTGGDEYSMRLYLEPDLDEPHVL